MPRPRNPKRPASELKISGHSGTEPPPSPPPPAPPPPAPPPPPASLTAAEIGAALGVSERMVGIYAGRGMPSFIGPRGKRRFELEECLEWVRLNAPEPVRGGKTPHRVRGDLADSPECTEVTYVGTSSPADSPDLPEGPRKEAAIAAEVQALLVAWLVERAVPEEISAAVLLAVNGGKAKGGGLTLTSIRTLKEGLEAERTADRLAQERKRLLATDDVRRAWTGAIARLRVRIEELPPRLGAAIAADPELALAPEHQLAVRRVLEAGIRGLVEELYHAEGAVRRLNAKASEKGT
ncbi:MAG: hypothetical protein AB7O32_00115 [Vicinamibacterales bacterium]